MASRKPTCNVDKSFIWLIWVVPWRNGQLVITILTVDNYLIGFHVCRRWDILVTRFNYWSGVNKGVTICICVVTHCCFIIGWNSWRIQYIKLRYSWTIVGNHFTNTFYIIMRTSSLQLSVLSTYRVTKFTRCSWWISLLVQNITFKWTWIWSSIVLTLNTSLCIWSKLCFITSWFVALGCCIWTWSWSIISWWSCVNYFIVSCLVHLSWWHPNLYVWFRFTLIGRCQVVVYLFCIVSECYIFILLDNHIHTCRTTVCRSIINKVWIVSISWKVTKVYFFTWVSWSQCCCCNFITCWFINQTNINIWIVCACCLIKWQSHVIVCIISLIVRLKVPNTKCQTIWSWVSWVSCRNCSWLVSKCRTVSIVHTWSCVNTCCKCIWSSDWCQLSWNCWSTVYSCVSSKSCCSQGCHHVIYWLAQTFALVYVWLSWSISVDQAVACCQFCLNFSDGSFNCCFLFWCWNSCWVVACDLVQQFCFWSVLFQNNFIISFSNSCRCFWSCFRSSCYSWFAKSCWKFCWTLFA